MYLNFKYLLLDLSLNNVFLFKPETYSINEISTASVAKIVICNYVIRSWRVSGKLLRLPIPIPNRLFTYQEITTGNRLLI